jgi:hypothetical protein
LRFVKDHLSAALKENIGWGFSISMEAPNRSEEEAFDFLLRNAKFVGGKCLAKSKFVKMEFSS